MGPDPDCVAVRLRTTTHERDEFGLLVCIVGHALAQKAGAALHNLDHQWNYALGVPDPRDPAGRRGLASFNPAAIWVNAEGSRFVNEFAGAKDSLPALLAQKGQTYWSVFDEAGKPSFSVTLAGWNDSRKIQKVIFDNPALVKSAPTLEELAARIGIPAGALVETVARYNRMVAGGEDKDFGRFGPGGSAARPAKIEAPPFYAVQFFPITRKSMGGIQVDRCCRVLDRQGQPIPGLYAVGELAGFGRDL
jgi:succinate dehydrogenase/fumarate reductase flavoprotein subunit